ncbi:MAG TPA: response regulator transcription factor [Acidimicrobiia bacterium]|nr:response regulator transcription factor [Acidimicrobiia bacterium]
MRVLVVEDEPRMATLLARGLREEGYSVDVAHDGNDGLWRATEDDYDAIVLDVMLPGINGLDLCRGLRASNRWAPVLLLTARDSIDDRVQGLDAGADDYLTKPFSFAELAARVRALVRRQSGARPTVLEVGGLRVDPARHQAWRDDIEVPLSPKEMALLELLMRRVGEVVTRTEILDHVWDFAYDGTSNVVDQYVAYLRKKIDRPFARADIETVRGVGYRLREPAVE